MDDKHPLIWVGGMPRSGLDFENFFDCDHSFGQFVDMWVNF